MLKICMRVESDLVLIEMRKVHGPRKGKHRGCRINAIGLNHVRPNYSESEADYPPSGQLDLSLQWLPF